MKPAFRASFACLLGAIACHCFAVSLRAGEMVPLDLSRQANHPRNAKLGRMAISHLGELPAGTQEWDGVPFVVGSDILLLGCTRNPQMPTVITGIPVGQKASQLHFIHACIFGAYEGKDSIKDGTRVGEYVVRYQDGSATRIALEYGVNTWDWWHHEKKMTGAKMVWEGGSASGKPDAPRLKHLYKMDWRNPSEDKLIATIEIHSIKTQATAPICIAITAEKTAEAKSNSQ